MIDLLLQIEWWADAWAESLFRATWQGGLVLAMVWVLTRTCAFLSPRVTCWMWRLACVKLLVALVWAAPVRLPLLPVEPAIRSPSQIAAVPEAEVLPGAGGQSLPGASPVTIASRNDASSLAKVAAMALWGFGVSCGIMTAGRQWRAARRLARLSVPVRERSLRALCRRQAKLLGARRLPELRISRDAACPALIGIARPMILFPHDVLTMFGSRELALMASHELAHWKRRDLAWNWLLLVVRVLFFFHPLVWVMTRGWSDSQESACDELVLSRGVAGPVEYSRLLLSLALRPGAGPRASFAAAGVFGTYGNLERRIMTMSRLRPLSRSSLSVAASFLIVAAIVSIVPWQLVAQDAKRSAQSPDAKDDEGKKQALELAVRQASMGNLKRIMLGMHQYASEHELAFPPAQTSQDGKPLLSWRVAILPYLDQRALYERFKLDEPWDSEHNKKLLSYMPEVYRSPISKLHDGRTVYLTPRGPETAFPGNQGIALRQVFDGTSATIAVVEASDAQAVPWTKPEDWQFDAKQPKAGLEGSYNGGFLVALCDGAALWLPNNIEAERLKALITRSGRD